ncbi:MAG: hypothetical protein SF029_19955 [bacterium]|nr:hypothetical protein [bacterium]
MPYKVTRVPNEPIVVLEVSSPFDMITDLPAVFADIAKAKAGVASLTYCLYDVRNLQITFSDVVMGLAAHTKGEPGSVSDPTIRVILIGSDELLRLASEALKQEQYGQIALPMYATYDEAIAEARRLAAQNAG